MGEPTAFKPDKVALGLTAAFLFMFLLRPVVPYFKDATDTIGLALLVAAALPWLSRYVESVKIGGNEAKFRSLVEEVKETKSLAVAATSQATDAIVVATRASATVEDASIKAAIAAETNFKTAAPMAMRQGAEGGGPTIETKSAVDGRLDQLVSDYEQLRATMESGSARTKRMGGLFQEMVAAVGERPTFDVNEALRSSSDGRRLLAVAAAYRNPEAVDLSALVASAEAETRAFNQYWALRAIRQVLVTTGRRPTLDEIARLRHLRDLLSTKPDRSRVAELTGILAELEPSRP